MRQKHFSIALLCIGAIVPAAMAISNVGPSLSFTPDLVINFDNLTSGSTLTNGSAIATGVTFNQVPGPSPLADAANTRASVVDTGGGNLALQQTVIANNGNPFGSTIGFKFTFAQPVESVALQVTQVSGGGAMDDNPGVDAYDTSSNFLGGFGTFPSNGDYMGVANSATPIVFFRFSATDFPSDQIFRIDNLSIQFAPEPGTLALLGIAGLAASLRRRLH
ncbi:MAG TPA: PEP-CTERM sorting domain-containing protein [Tepidisphaeraceae bacterium]|nr:PEP-CTERM sorting domain-containing protein [Tepidisphaeraceae bacterium]